MPDLEHRQLGRTDLAVPPIVFGTSCLGNLYRALDDATKLAIVREYFAQVPAPVVLDSAGKYGAGLALEVIGRCLRELDIPPEQVVISNKLGWQRVPLETPEPTFEPGAWVGLDHDAVQRIDGDGIRRCWEQGADLLGAPYRPRLASVHDPDEYLAAATDAADADRRWADIVAAYESLLELKAAGEVAAVGVGSKDWRTIRRLATTVDLDWVMFACSLTVMHHPPELLAFMGDLHARGVGMINSAVFHAGFLTGGKYFDYRVPDPRDPADAQLFAWRDRFREICAAHAVAPAAVCVQFGLSVPGVVSVALNTSKPERVRENAELVTATVPPACWGALKAADLVDPAYPYLP